MKIAAGTSRGVTTDLPDAAKPEHLTAALRRHGVLLAGRVRDVTTEGPRDTLVSRIFPQTNLRRRRREGINLADPENVPAARWYARGMAARSPVL